ncbi:unnamed protein product [Protopolystoma xenopodis]|uniref:Protein kinase domain-containing protein n=1 Tax=Protopolystoma xenopodis TaxID=117903 RepID=A0A448WDB4_9PLAT|nr:unnamed protein product [Protopolystoma xenopodis]
MPLYCLLPLLLSALGKPTERSWPGISEHPQLAKALASYPAHPGEPGGLLLLAPRLNRSGHALLASLLRYDGPRRISATDALDHPYFTDPLVSSLPTKALARLPPQASVFEVPDMRLARDAANPGTMAHR